MHCGRNQRVTATFRFNGKLKERTFALSTRVEGVFRWATSDQVFDLPRDQRAKRILCLNGTEVEADRDAYLGSLATDGIVAFELAPKEPYAGQQHGPARAAVRG